MSESSKRRYVLGFMVDPTFQHVVLIKKDTDKPEQQWQNGQFNGIGGGVEGDELIQMAMRREFQEETGVWTDPTEWIHCGDIKDAREKLYVVYCFMQVAPLEILQRVCKQPNEKEVPAVYHYALVKNGYYNLANNVKELLIMCRWAYEQRKAGKFRKFEMITD
jgi:8-oxo-dGTP pyrophosphatase MutT (NUDIX family)